jgi:ABC-type phosphate/phosphonate transport system substrate-binding protein
VEGGAGPDYSSVVLMRREGLDPQSPPHAVPAPAGGQAVLPLPLLRNRRLAFNGPDSMSGRIALERDLWASGESLDLFSEQIESGGHRLSIRMLAAWQADVCAVDCRSWWLAQRFEPAAQALVPVGWTARRPGLPFVMAPRLAYLREAVRAALAQTLLLRN